MFTYRIPNIITLPVLIAGLVYNAWRGGFLSSVEGALAGFAFGFICYYLNFMGAGDGKMMGALGAWLGFKPLEMLSILFVACLLGAVVGIIKIARTGQLKTWIVNTIIGIKLWILTRDNTYISQEIGGNLRANPNVIPFGFFIMLGAWLVMGRGGTWH